jgi:hypothetical protein
LTSRITISLHKYTQNYTSDFQNFKNRKVSNKVADFSELHQYEKSTMGFFPAKQTGKHPSEGF